MGTRTARRSTSHRLCSRRAGPSEPPTAPRLDYPSSEAPACSSERSIPAAARSRRPSPAPRASTGPSQGEGCLRGCNPSSSAGASLAAPRWSLLRPPEARAARSPTAPARTARPAPAPRPSPGRGDSLRAQLSRRERTVAYVAAGERAVLDVSAGDGYCGVRAAAQRDEHRDGRHHVRVGQAGAKPARHRWPYLLLARNFTPEAPARLRARSSRSSRRRRFRPPRSDRGTRRSCGSRPARPSRPGRSTGRRPG